MATTTEPSQINTSKSPTSSSSGSSKKLSEQMSSRGFWRDAMSKSMADQDRWAKWAKHLEKRRSPRLLNDLGPVQQSSLFWGLNPVPLSSRTLDLLSMVDQLVAQNRKGKRSLSDEEIERLLAAWLEGSRVGPQTLDFALESLAVAHSLPKVPRLVSAEFWWSLLDALWAIAQSAVQWRSDAALPPEQGLAQQLLAGELPLTLAYLFPEMKPVGKLRAVAAEALAEGMAELTNGNGLVQGSYLGHQRPLLACWTRCRAMGEQLKKGCWNRKTEEQYQWMVTHALGLSSSKGTPLLGDPHGEAWTPDFLAAVISYGGDEADATAAKAIFGKKLTSAIKLKADDSEPETSDNCEWAGVAYMRTAWDRKEALLAIDYHTPDLKLECWLGSQRLLAGTWTWETTLNGKRLEPVGSWDETCWLSDEDVDYLELSLDLAGGARLERQILLARDEMILLLADYVLDTSGGELVHRYRLPLSGGIEFEPEQETREGNLSADKPLARVLPLALPEWRTDPRFGKLTSANGRLQLEQQMTAKNLACPLLIDLDKSRLKKECTWRQLTVAESLEIQPPEVAVGYRAQCGSDQWLIYRSLAEKANRTLLGQNLSSECLIARFLAPEGEVDELIEIE